MHPPGLLMRSLIPQRFIKAALEKVLDALEPQKTQEAEVQEQEPESTRWRDYVTARESSRGSTPQRTGGG